MKLIDLSGKVFGRLTVISRSENKGRQTSWLCVCSCGTEVKVMGSKLKSGETKSCGCLHKEVISTHKMTNTRPYSIWANMIDRCENKNSPAYKNYGNIGIFVCDDWKTFMGFWQDMSNFYDDSLSLDRIDNSKGYFPENCRWTTRSEQTYNQRKRDNNTSTKTGVYFNKNTGMWEAYINKDSKRYRLGYFNTFDDAVRAREVAEIYHYGYVKQ